MKAKVERPDGSSVEVEGTPDEVREFLAWEALLRGPPQPPLPFIIPIPTPLPTYPSPSWPWQPVFGSPGTAIPLPTVIVTCDAHDPTRPAPGGSAGT